VEPGESLCAVVSIGAVPTGARVSSYVVPIATSPILARPRANLW
jgi:hypothetical protein